jgi:hypothetical protein
MLLLASGHKIHNVFTELLHRDKLYLGTVVCTRPILLLRARVVINFKMNRLLDKQSTISKKHHSSRFEG